ncbi:hypothetical protein QTN25_010749 [Entamoeba marina]
MEENWYYIITVSSIICLADGCGVGRNVYKAADIAANTAVQTVPYTHFPLGQRNRFDTRKQDLSDPSSLYYTMRTSPQSMSPVAFSKDHTTTIRTTIIT